MPNHISNLVYLRKSAKDNDPDDAAMDALCSLMKTEDSPFDFEALFPYPTEWDALDREWRKGFDQGIPMSKLPADGYNHGGYDWCIKTWGTGGNAYDIGFNYDGVHFNTAWATPRPIWVELSKRFPAFQLVVEYADEDIGSNCGIIVYQNGNVVSEVKEQGLTDPDLFARAVRAEQEAASSHYELLEAQRKIKELEGKIAQLEQMRSATLPESTPDSSL